MKLVNHLQGSIVNHSKNSIFIKDADKRYRDPIEINIFPRITVFEVKAFITDVVANSPEYGKCLGSILIYDSSINLDDYKATMYSKSFMLDIESAQAAIYFEGDLEKLEEAVEKDENIIPRNVNGWSPNTKWDEYTIRVKEKGFCDIDNNVLLVRTGLGDGSYEVKAYYKPGNLKVAQVIEIIFH